MTVMLCPLQQFGCFGGKKMLWHSGVVSCESRQALARFTLRLDCSDCPTQRQPVA